MPVKLGFAVAAALLIGSTLASHADPAGLFVREELRIPMAAAGPRGLEALLIRPNAPGRFPLALINHGSPRSAADRPSTTTGGLQPEAMEFARRGIAAVVVLRRGYGESGGTWAESYGSCENPNYVAGGRGAAADLKAAVVVLGQRPEIDTSRVISVGVSAGGFASVALAAEAPPGLEAVINFAGGRGSPADDQNCNEERLVEAFGVFGKTARVPMLWVYAENDHFFGPRLAQRLKAAFIAGGDAVDFVTAPAFGTNGHFLFSLAGIPIWTTYADDFLKQHHLAPRETLLPLPRPALVAPAWLKTNARKNFDDYLIAGPHKAFAASPQGAFGGASGKRTADDAKATALKACPPGSVCRVLFVDDGEAH